jgi:hypothetical protein
MDLNSHPKNYKESTPLYTLTPAFPKSPCNEQACTPNFCLLSHRPQAAKWSLRGKLLGGNNILETAAYPAAWPARKKSKSPFLLRASLPTAPQRVASKYTQPPFFAQANGHLPAICPPPQKTALLADKAELVTTEMCLQSSIISIFDLAGGAAADFFCPLRRKSSKTPHFGSRFEVWLNFDAGFQVLMGFYRTKQLILPKRPPLQY